MQHIKQKIFILISFLIFAFTIFLYLKPNSQNLQLNNTYSYNLNQVQKLIDENPKLKINISKNQIYIEYAILTNIDINNHVLYINLLPYYFFNNNLLPKDYLLSNSVNIQYNNINIKNTELNQNFTQLLWRPVKIKILENGDITLTILDQPKQVVNDCISAQQILNESAIFFKNVVLQTYSSNTISLVNTFEDLTFTNLVQDCNNPPFDSELMLINIPQKEKYTLYDLYQLQCNALEQSKLKEYTNVHYIPITDENIKNFEKNFLIINLYMCPELKEKDIALLKNTYIPNDCNFKIKLAQYIYTTKYLSSFNIPTIYAMYQINNTGFGYTTTTIIDIYTNLWIYNLLQLTQ